MKPTRPIRSFVLRQGRLTPAQQRALETHWPRFGLELRAPASDSAIDSAVSNSSSSVKTPAATPAPRDFDIAFGRTAPRVLEIGFGNGEALRWAAERDPARDFLGIEVHRPGVGRLLNALAEADLPNVRVYCHDAVEVLRQEIADASLAEIRIWFPDPWPKKRHHKRRLIQPEFVALLARKLEPGGLLHLATDWQDYARHVHEVMDAAADFRNRAGAGGRSPRPAWRPPTHFEQRGLRLGHEVWDLLYDRI